jgi:hypothetical protein
MEGLRHLAAWKWARRQGYLRGSVAGRASGSLDRNTGSVLRVRSPKFTTFIIPLCRGAKAKTMMVTWFVRGDRETDGIGTALGGVDAGDGARRGRSGWEDIVSGRSGTDHQRRSVAGAWVFSSHWGGGVHCLLNGLWMPDPGRNFVCVDRSRSLLQKADVAP